MPRLVGLVSAVLFVLAACGDDAEGREDEASGSEPAAEPTTSTTATDGEELTAEDLGLDELPGSPDRVPIGDFGEVAIAIEAPDGSVLGWCVLLADAPELRQRGLMEVTDLQGYEGMLFVWDADSSNSFYMRNTPTPLSIAWFEEDGDLVSTADMEPCADVEGCPLYAPGGSYRYALEVPQGQLDDIGVEAGSRLRVGAACAPRAGET